ncbi:MAG: FkbM family methyltransferase [Tannerella sp.]|jgi:FkbM family methyltransferase|nr:FkbM family methyltransferase [Tannerella sp.]
MDFKELLRPGFAGKDEEVMASLRRSPYPVLLYGAAADVGGRIVNRLQENSLHIAGIVLDGDCPTAAIALPALADVEVCTPEEADRRFAAYHVIAGFVGGYGRTDRIAQKCRNARSVEYLSELFGMEVITPSFVLEHREPLETLYGSLGDALSKDSLVAYLLAKTRQDMCYLPPFFERTQYFPTGFFTLTDHESYFDCGAFTGDTVADFLTATGGRYRYIWAAEPDPSSYRQLMRFIADRQLTAIEAVNRGIYSFAGRLPFHAEGSMLSMIADGASQTVDVDTVDRIAAGRPVSYIKMDVEGAELMALHGATQTILAHRPLLGISIYHRQRDLIDIPAFICSLVPEYRFYFRVHKKLAIDTVLYAVAPR